MPVKPVKFRQKIVLLALALVVGVQTITLFSVLRIFERDNEISTQRSVGLAGVVFDEFFSNRSEQLQTAASVLVADFGFREAVATREPETINSVLSNHLARIEADLGLLMDPDGRLIATTLARSEGDFARDVERAVALFEEGTSSILSISGRAFHVVEATIRAPLPLARVLIGFEIDADLVSYLKSITGLDVTFVGGRVGSMRTFASTLDSSAPEVSAAQLASGSELVSDTAQHSVIRQFVYGDEPVYAVLQLSLAEANASYRNVQWTLVVITLFSVSAALIGSLLVGRMVTKPVDRLIRAVRRMGDGDYSERIDLESGDEFGELATGFNSMQLAIADRQEQIIHSARYDSRTGLPNRQFVLTALEDAIRAGRHVAVANLTIMRLGKLIASLGHELSDKMIQRIAQVLSDGLDGEHVIGSVGSDEFVIVFVDMGVAEIERKLLILGRSLEEDVRVEGVSYSLNIRAGIASAFQDLSGASALLYGASIARMEAEERHEVVKHYEHGQEERAIRQTRLLGEFADAVEQDQLEVFMQPKVSCRTGEVHGAEALVRWRHPEYGMLPPYEFVETIEKAGAISRLTRWMLRRSLRECRAWRDAGFDIGVAVNISADDLLDEYLPYFLLDEIAALDLRAASVTLEVTESAIMHNLKKSLSVIQCVHELGFRISVDDFGTGHSSLAQLRRLPADELKIDRSFLVDMEASRDVSIVLATIEMANGLGLDVCAEGIENLNLLPTLYGMGARYGQGYAIARPMPSAEFIDWCRAYQPPVSAIEDAEEAAALTQTARMRARSS